MGEYKPPKDLIISLSGMRGIIGDSLDPEVILKFVEAFGYWLVKKLGRSPKILIGMDPRTSGTMVKNISIGALLSIGAEILDADVCATPLLLFGHKYHECDGTVIISASHNPPEYNGMKCLGPHGTFLGNEDLEEVYEYFHGISKVSYISWKDYKPVRDIKTLPNDYFNEMKKYLDLETFLQQNGNTKLKVIVDPGCGAGTGITAKYLEDLGCNSIEINAKVKEDGTYPRMFEPTIENLSLLSKTINELGCDVAFAHDFDADRVTLIGEKGQIYREDVIVALLWKLVLERARDNKIDEIKTVTNCASSLMLDDLANQFGAEIHHTPVGERNLAVKMNELRAFCADKEKSLVFGGEGSCGGFMLPEFNNTRDGILSAILICELLLKTKKTITQLVEEVPCYYSTRKNVKLDGMNALEIMSPLKSHLNEKDIKFETISNDVKIFGEKEWTLVHPSNTEPIIRVITEASTMERAEELVKEMHELLIKF